MIWLKMETINVGTVIDLSGLGLDTIEETADNFSIGAMVTLRQLEQHSGLNAYTDGAVRESVCHIVGVQLRNLATVGGSIYSRFGFSDVLTMFLALDASVELYKGGIVSLAEYAYKPYDRDILVRVIVPKMQAKFCYQSVRNSQTDFPVLTCAAVKTAEGGYRFAIGARPGKAVLYNFQPEEGENTEQKAAHFSAEVRADIKTESNMRGVRNIVTIFQVCLSSVLSGSWMPHQKQWEKKHADKCCFEWDKGVGRGCAGYPAH